MSTADRTDINEIISLSSAKKAQEAISDMSATLAVVPNDHSVKDIEPYLEGRNRYRGELKTNHVEDFAKYSEEYSSNDNKSVCFINSEEMKAVCLLNIGSLYKPGHGDHKAVVNLLKTGAYSSILACTENSTALTQKQLTDWIEDWHDQIQFYKNWEDANDNVSAISLAKSLAAIRTITIEEKQESTHKEGPMRASRSTLEQVDVDSRDETLPGFFVFSFKPYEALSENAVTVRISVITSHEKPRFKLSIIAKEKFKEDLTEEFKDLVESAMNSEKTDIYIGNFSL